MAGCGKARFLVVEILATGFEFVIVCLKLESSFELNSNFSDLFFNQLNCIDLLIVIDCGACSRCLIEVV